MTDRMKRDRIGGTSFCIENCYVWAGIHYLDSPTDYRECLPKNNGAPLAVSDDEVNSFKCLSESETGAPLVMLIFVILLVTVGWLFYSC